MFFFSVDVILYFIVFLEGGVRVNRIFIIRKVERFSLVVFGCLGGVGETVLVCIR